MFKHAKAHPMAAEVQIVPWKYVVVAVYARVSRHFPCTRLIEAERRANACSAKGARLVVIAAPNERRVVSWWKAQETPWSLVDELQSRHKDKTASVSDYAWVWDKLKEEAT